MDEVPLLCTTASHFRIWVSGSRFRVPGSGFRVPGSDFQVSAFSFRVEGLQFRDTLYFEEDSGSRSGTWRRGGLQAAQGRATVERIWLK